MHEKYFLIILWTSCLPPEEFTKVMETYFNEETVADLDFTGLGENAQRFIEQHFDLVRSKRVIFSPFVHKIDLCLISNVEPEDVKDVKDEKLKALLKSNPVLSRVYTELSKYHTMSKLIFLCGVSFFRKMGKFVSCVIITILCLTTHMKSRNILILEISSFFWIEKI